MGLRERGGGIRMAEIVEFPPGEPAKIEPWVDQRHLCELLACKPRWIEYRLKDGLPHALIAGRRKFRLSEVERWLERHGHMERRGCA